MSKKDFEALAKALNKTRPPEDHIKRFQWRLDVRAVADVLSADNPRFDYRLFLDACGYKP